MHHSIGWEELEPGQPAVGRKPFGTRPAVHAYRILGRLRIVAVSRFYHTSWLQRAVPIGTFGSLVILSS